MPHRPELHGLEFILSLICLTSHFAAPSSRAQVIDSFDDGNFHSEPSWMGETDLWQIGDLNGPALQSNGTAVADTIHLSVASETAFGRWEFTFAHRSVNLSSFNGARIFLSSDRPDPRRSAAGYYLQFGTNNSDVVSLWRADGSLATQRVELARSNEALAAGDSSHFGIAVERDTYGRFRVYANDALILTASDSRHSSSGYFSIWVKHTAQGAASFFLDDLVIMEGEHDEPDGPIPSAGEIVINEVLFDPSPGQSEFIELENRGRTPFDLRYLRFRDARSGQIPVSYAAYLIEPGQYAVLVEDSTSFISNAAGVPYLAIDGWPPLNNGGDSIILTGPAGVIDSLTYSGSGSVRGVSLERIDPDGPSESYNFERSSDISGSTPGRINSVFAVDSSAPFLRFVDQIGPKTLDLHFNEPVRMDELAPSSVLYSARVLDLSPLTPTAVRVIFDGPVTDLSIGVEHVRDRKGNRSERLMHPVSFLPRLGDLLFTEVMYEPLVDAYDGRADQVEFVEMVNAGDRRLSVAELVRTRDVDEHGDADTLRFGRSFSALMPGKRLVVSAHDSAAVQAAFPSTEMDSESVHIVASGLTLPNGGDRLRLLNRLGEPIDDVAYVPAWHHPDVVQARGRSLERIDVNAPSADAANWSSSVAVDGATPGATNSLALEAQPVSTSAGITVQPSPFSPDGDGSEDVAVISYHLRTPNPNIRIRIYDLDGFEVRNLVPAAISTPEGRVVWDGRDDADRPLRVGIYIILFEAVDAETRTTEKYKRPVVLARSFR